MKLGAQLFSIRTECTTPESLYSSMKKIKDIGYEIVQVSGVCKIEAERLLSYSEELSLPITCTHRPYAEITESTAEVIKYHKTIKCPVIGLGSMPKDMRGSRDGLEAFIKAMKTPLEMITDSGLTFAYHNHGFEFEKLDGKYYYDIIMEELPELHFIHDVYWSKYAGADPLYYVNLLGEAGRMTNIHFKDMISDPQGDMCPCGVGVIDFRTLADACRAHGIDNVLVEQDNAPTLGDVFEQMKTSYENLKNIVK